MPLFQIPNEFLITLFPIFQKMNITIATGDNLSLKNSSRLLLIVFEMSRFKKVTDCEIDCFRNASSAKNTKVSTNTWVNVYNNWASERGYSKPIYEYAPVELDGILQRFYVEIRKRDREENEPQCLNVMCTSLDRYLRDNDYKLSII